MSLPRIDNWLDLVFWIFAAGVATFMAWVFLTILYRTVREWFRGPEPPRGPTHQSSDDSWSLGGGGDSGVDSSGGSWNE